MKTAQEMAESANEVKNKDVWHTQPIYTGEPLGGKLNRNC